MSTVLGFEFYQGPEVPPPFPIDFTMEPAAISMRREKWAELLEDQVRYHDAWAILIVKPNTDVLLFDVIQDSSAYEATGWGGTAYLLLTKESQRFDAPLVNASGVAAILGVTRQRVSKLYQAGRLPQPVAMINGHRPAWFASQFESAAPSRCDELLAKESR